MKNISLYVPTLEDYWYEEKVQNDPLSMSYNAGYDVSYSGYHYDNGCIDFPSSRWEESYNRRINEDKYFAYLKDVTTGEFVGYVNYHYNKNDDAHQEKSLSGCLTLHPGLTCTGQSTKIFHAMQS